jgi:endonuclease YncB( thermonuclease family)
MEVRRIKVPRFYKLGPVTRLGLLLLALAIAPSADPKLVIGEYGLHAERGIIDGDTFRVKGLKQSLRLLAIDTEEQPRTDYPSEELTRLMRSDFAAYSQRMAQGRALPAKYPTPMGERATEFARSRIPPGSKLRLERDVAGSGADLYGRLLCYVWVLPPGDGQPWLYNLEAVRAGMTPYFIKYGRSKRFDAEFRAAQAEAREAKRGIWDDSLPHYPDYEARLAWWERRATALENYARLAVGDDPPVLLGDKSAIGVLLRRVGERVRVFGLLDDHDPAAVRIHEGGATLRLGGAQPIEIEIAGSDRVERLKLVSLRGEFLLVEGVLDRRGSPLKRKTRYMRIPVTDDSQLRPGY